MSSSTAATIAAIRTTHAAIAARTGSSIVSLADLRAELPAHIDRWTATDWALLVLGRERGVCLMPEANQKALDARTRLAAVRVGDQDKHLLHIDHTVLAQPAAPTTPVPTAQPAPAPAPAITVEDIARQLQTLADVDQAAQLVAKLTGRQVTEVARLTGAAVPASGRVADRRRALIRPVAMRARTASILRVGRGSYNPTVTVSAG